MKREDQEVSARTIATSADNDHEVVTSKSVYMKISSDRTTVGFYYSLDMKDWLLTRLFKNDCPSSIWVRSAPDLRSRWSRNGLGQVNSC